VKLAKYTPPKLAGGPLGLRWKTSCQSRSRNSILFLMVPFRSVASFSAFWACRGKKENIRQLLW